MVVLTAETCWALNEYWINNKISGIKLVFYYKDDARSHKHKEPNKLELWNKLYFEEKETESI